MFLASLWIQSDNIYIVKKKNVKFSISQFLNFSGTVCSANSSNNFTHMLEYTQLLNDMIASLLSMKGFWS